ncbi:MAG: putative glutamine amidotransferase [Phycisphaerae bacterium]|nr:putative glutamine amidotransferase [Phycisphaerae bacterium]
MKPRIGVTCSFAASQTPPHRPRTSLNAAYSDAIYAAGGIPFPIAPPAQPDPDTLQAVLANLDGLLFTGGPDLNPRHYGQTPHAKTEILDARRDAFDIALFAAADQRRLPILSICLGCQIASVARGGCLVQHVDDLPRRNALQHHAGHDGTFHDVEVDPQSRLAAIAGRTRFEVNSRHHQVIDRSQVGGRLRPVAFAPDGVVEAAEDMENGFLLAVQWHPEDLIDRPEHLRLFQALVAASRKTP